MILTRTKNYSEEKIMQKRAPNDTLPLVKAIRSIVGGCKLRKCRQDIGIRTNNWLQGVPDWRFINFCISSIFGAKTKQASTSARRSCICHQAVLSILQAICVKFPLTKFSKTAKKLVVRGKLWSWRTIIYPKKKPGGASTAFNLDSWWYLPRDQKSFLNSCAWKVSPNPYDCHRNLRWTRHTNNYGLLEKLFNFWTLPKIFHTLLWIIIIICASGNGSAYPKHWMSLERGEKEKQTTIRNS